MSADEELWAVKCTFDGDVTWWHSDLTRPREHGQWRAEKAGRLLALTSNGALYHANIGAQPGGAIIKVVRITRKPKVASREAYEGTPVIAMKSSEHHAHIRKPDGCTVDVNYILRHRYLDKHVRVTLEVLEP